MTFPNAEKNVIIASICLYNISGGSLVSSLGGVACTVTQHGKETHPNSCRRSAAEGLETKKGAVGRGALIVSRPAVGQ